MCAKAVESNPTFVVSSASGVLAAPGPMPLVPVRALLGFVGLPTAALKTARDSLRLNCAGQAKNVRRFWKCCTRHAHVFHRRKFAAFVPKPFSFQPNFRQEFFP